MPRTIKLSVEDLLAQLKKHQSRLPRLQRKEQKILKQLAAVQDEIAQLGGLAKSRKSAKVGRPAKVAKAAKTRGVRRAKNSVKLADAIVGVLAKDSTLSVPQIASAVKAAGYVSKSKTFETIIYQTVARDKRVKRAGRGQYQLKA